MILRAALRCRRADESISNLTVVGCFTRRPHLSSRVRASFSSIQTLPIDEVTVENLDKKHLQSELQSIVGPYHQRQQPLVVRRVVKETPATKLWSSWDYWESTTIGTDNGDPLVSVEIGESYGKEGSERAEIPFSAYLQFLRLFEERHGRNGSLPGVAGESPIPSEELVYMAQNDLLVPLYKDTMIPDFCENGSGTTDASSGIGLGRLYSVMMWLGPRGCVSPLHYDPLDNCFLQHVGRKRVLLFDPKSNSGGPWHYAGHDGQQSNTSPIDPEVLDDISDNDTSEEQNVLDDYRRRFPIFFEEAPDRLESVLEPGDFLYIPSKWWHHVRSIDTCASVNVWWR